MAELVNSGSETNLEDGIPFISRELARYFIASGIALLIDAGTLYLLTRFADVYYLVSAATGFTLGLITIYLLSIHWVFSKRRIKNPTMNCLFLR